MIHDQEKIAFHEAGHAITHHYYNHEIQKVAFSEECDSGYCDVAEEMLFEEKEVQELAERQLKLQCAVCACAGRAVMGRMSGRRKDYGWKRSEDRALALKHCMKLAEGDEIAAEHLLAFAMRRAESLVENLWPQIHKVAFGLLEHFELSGKQIHELLARDENKLRQSIQV